LISMSTYLRTSVAATVLAVAVALAVAAGEPETPREPDVRLVYEADTRAYYQPCG
jgi:hypothetical protein